jgi:uncharacterized protein (TIGR01777 family)
MKIILAGASGLIGRALADRLRADGDTVVRLVRRPPAAPDELSWDPRGGAVPAAVGEADAVVNLAGAGIADGRWTARRRQLLLSSRLEPTAALASAVRAAPGRHVLVNASAVGYYGDRGDEAITEDSARGVGFLADLCRDWEAAAEAATGAGAGARATAGTGTRVVRVRFGVVLAAQGGALPRLLPLFRLGLGGRLGSGRQWMSWIALDDAVGVLRWAIRDGRAAGPVNAVAPELVTNAIFTATLARVLRRPAFLPVPRSVLSLVLGQMGRETLLAGARVEPERLVTAGYTFVHPMLEDALRQILAR